MSVPFQSRISSDDADIPLQWTSKTYDFETPPTPLPPLIHQTCRDAVRAVPWPSVLGQEPSIDGEWSNWSQDYEPHAGIINFVRLALLPFSPPLTHSHSIKPETLSPPTSINQRSTVSSPSSHSGAPALLPLPTELTLRTQHRRLRSLPRRRPHSRH